ncbi:hypothetical protein Tcan_04608 [Toxocara canis]|uniref:Uncharacterized protein n=1 Tax=Toxocara canis TaxID=6265 RepID=A0A0B2VW07_TOXCA|nr:hypothetical protein Tcan_04608 [Toxocara canis]
MCWSKLLPGQSYRQGRGSNLLIAPRGDSLTDKLLSSPICRGEDGAAPIPSFAALTAGTATDSAENDPELAMIDLSRDSDETEDVISLTFGRLLDKQVTGTDPSLLPEDQQLEWALRLSMQGSCTGTGRHPISTASATFPLSASEQSTAAANVTTLPVGRQVEIDIKPPSAESRQSSVTGTDPSLLPEDQQLEWALRLSMQGSCTGTGRHPISSTAPATFPLSASEQSTAAANVTTLPVGRQVEIDIKPPSAESRQSSDKKNAEKPDEVHKR